jgi:hypothetical protein
MTVKLSPYKLSKMMSLYFQGYSQSEIANKLKIDQSTVCQQVPIYCRTARSDGETWHYTLGRIVWSRLEEQVAECFNFIIISNGRGSFYRLVYRTEESLWIV